MTYTTAHGNTRSLTHWVRSGMEPVSSWMLIIFVSTESWWDFFFFGTSHSVCGSGVQALLHWVLCQAAITVSAWLHSFLDLPSMWLQFLAVVGVRFPSFPDGHLELFQIREAAGSSLPHGCFPRSLKTYSLLLQGQKKKLSYLREGPIPNNILTSPG